MEEVHQATHEHLGSALTYDSTVNWDPAGATVHVRALDYVLGGPRSKSLLFEIGRRGSGGGRLIATGLNVWQTYPFVEVEKAYLLWKRLDAGFRG